MKKNTILYILIVINLGLTLFLFSKIRKMSSARAERHELREGRLFKNIHFNAEQREEIRASKQLMDSLNAPYVQKREGVMSDLLTYDGTVTATQKDSLMRTSVELVYIMQKNLVDHLGTVYELATDEQKSKLDTLLPGMSKRFAVPIRPPKHHRKNHRE